jgi:hypothetical protein
VIAVTSIAAAAPSTERCQQGLLHAANNDLPRAALYLEGCDQLELEPAIAAELARTRASVAHKLDASKLSAMTVVTTPEGMLAETDAMPGERFTTPATIWTKAGDYTINIAPDAATLDASRGLTATASIDPFSRRTVIINVPQKQAAPKDGKVDFREDVEEQASHAGPPPAQKFGSILPKKYRQPGSEAGSGPQLDDPLAYRVSNLAWRLGARFGGGLVMQDNENAAASFSVAALASRPLTGPVSLATRLGWSHRKVDAVALELGLGFRLASTPALVVTVGAGLRGDVRVQDRLAMEEVARVGIGGAVEIDLVLRTVPVTIGLRFEPGFTELTPGARAHGFMLEVGYDWR